MTNHPNRSRQWVLTEIVSGPHQLGAHLGPKLTERIVAQGTRNDMVAEHGRLQALSPVMEHAPTPRARIEQSLELRRRADRGEYTVMTRSVQHISAHRLTPSKD